MKISLSKDQWKNIGRAAGWLSDRDESAAAEKALRHERIRSPVAEDVRKSLSGGETHSSIALRQHLATPCHPQDLIIVDEGLQCGHCGAITRDHGKTWEDPRK